MADTTYGQLFQDYLEERLRAGGDPGYIVEVARIYAAEGQYDEHHVRDYPFRDWLRDAQLSCCRCRKPFRPTDGRVDESTEGLCSACSKGDCGRLALTIRRAERLPAADPKS